MGVSSARCRELVNEFGSLVRNGKYLARRVDESVGLPGFSTPLLSALERDGEQRLGQLACGMHLDPSVISRHVAMLEKHGFIARRPDPDDGRASLLQLTATGAAALADGRQARASVIKSMFADWDDEQLAHLVSLVRRTNQAGASTAVDEALEQLDSSTSVRKVSA